MFTGGGTVVARYDYDPYGRSTTVLGTTPTDFNFTGLYRHSKSNLDLATYRAYDPDLGRWLNRDPIGERGGTNLYGYVQNKPLTYVDSLGLWGEDVHRGAPGQNYGTYTWARQLGYSDQTARDIGRANIGTDSGATSPFAYPWNANVSGRSRHFDIPLGGLDSRDAWAWREMQTALDLSKTDKCGAYEALGRGLHSIQDYYAHGDWNNEGHPYTYHGSHLDDWQGRPEMHERVEQATKAYLQFYLNMVHP